MRIFKFYSNEKEFHDVCERWSVCNVCLVCYEVSEPQTVTLSKILLDFSFPPLQLTADQNMTFIEPFCKTLAKTKE